VVRTHHFIERRDSNHSTLICLHFLLHAYIISLSDVSQKAPAFSQITHKACAKSCVMTLTIFQRSLPCSAAFGLTLDPSFCFVTLSASSPRS
jgi:hypothetical protein